MAGNIPARLGATTLTLLVAALGPAAVAAQEPPAQAVLIRNITVIDGSGAPAQAGRDVEVRDGRIVAVRLAAPAEVAFDGTVEDGTGLFLIPGLIDAHVHLASHDREGAERALRWLLEGGVTRVRDMAGDARPLAALSADLLKGRIPGPAIYYSALMAGPEFQSDPRLGDGNMGYEAGTAPYTQEVSENTDIVRAVARAKGTGATGVKLYADLAPGPVRALTEEAHAQGLRVWAHAAVFPSRPVEILDAGVDGVSHAPYVIWEGAPRTADFTLRARGDFDGIPVDHPAVDAVLEAMLRNGTVLDPTLFVFSGPDGRFEDDTTAKRFAWAAAFTARAAAAGIPIAAGTDSPGRPLAGNLPNVHAEMELYVTAAGLTPSEAIRAATWGGAAAIGIEDRAGLIAPGYDADLVILGADPTLDIRNTRTVRQVYQAGRRVR